MSSIDSKKRKICMDNEEDSNNNTENKLDLTVLMNEISKLSQIVANIQNENQQCLVNVAKRNLEWNTYYHKWFAGKIGNFISIQFNPNNYSTLIDAIVNNDSFNYLNINDSLLNELKSQSKIVDGAIPILVPNEPNYMHKKASCISLTNSLEYTDEWCGGKWISNYLFINNISAKSCLNKNYYIIINEIGKM